ncbi:Rrf2 family transcriptional regulator [candidate division KSB3 bacterium]|uniref:Rrf2 family transcriptional regulator n=1 Tax=candidate division KSB3 bacterium TaxID=2044937 RepID=A0A9D5Q3V6_9BACT|nr:Rrf2 family transcriptional regulator [candidate division KSB3 bacterium]MBD3323054.1 Rrf2 family transcriptional regulator [candidate division KSB3 bacterium]
MLQLTSRGNYGIVAVYYIARHSERGFISIDEIAENSEIPKPYLSKILQNLCRSGLLLSRRGSGGGFALARSPEHISLKDIIEVIEGKVYLVNCLLNPSQCERSTSCPISPIWLAIQNMVVEVIASITIDDIIHDEKKQEMLSVLETCRNLYHERVQSIKSH